MKKLALLLLLAFGFALSCTPTPLIDEKNNQNDLGDEYACPAPDTNCNGIPDHEE